MTRKLFTGFSIIIILLQSLLISYISYIDFINLQIRISNSLISDKAITVSFKEGSTSPTLKELVETYPKVTILSELYNNSELQVWGVSGEYFLNKKTESFVEGRFFNNDDFFKNEFKSLIGKDILNSEDYFKDKNGKNYFLFYDNYYEVIGYLSSNISNMLDNTVFINLDSFDNKLNIITIDSFDSTNIVNVINNLKKEYNVDVIKEQNNFIETYIFNDTDIHILNILVIFFTSILFITLLILILRYYNEEIKVKRIIGIDFKKILFNIFGSLILLTVINTVLITTIYAIIHYIFLQRVYISFYFYNLVIFSILILATLCFSIYIYMIISNRLFYKNGVK